VKVRRAFELSFEKKRKTRRWGKRPANRIGRNWSWLSSSLEQNAGTFQICEVQGEEKGVALIQSGPRLAEDRDQACVNDPALKIEALCPIHCAGFIAKWVGSLHAV
jgi:hypothetical protein